MIQIINFSHKNKVATLPGNLKKPGNWEIKKTMEFWTKNMDFLTIKTHAVVKFWFETKNLLYK